MNGKTEKVWFSAGHHYRITWRSEVFGVSVAPDYQAAVLCVRYGSTDEHWAFAGARRPFKTMRGAIEACEANERIWNAFIALGGEPGRRTTKLADLVERSKIGNKPTVNVMLRALPKWAQKDADPNLLRMLFAPARRGRQEDDDECNDQPDPSQTSSPTEQGSSDTPGPSSTSSSSIAQEGGPASTAAAEEKSTSPPASTKSVASGKRASAVKAGESGREKSSKRLTTLSSKTSGRKGVGTTRTTKRTAKRSKS